MGIKRHITNAGSQPPGLSLEGKQRIVIRPPDKGAVSFSERGFSNPPGLRPPPLSGRPLHNLRIQLSGYYIRWTAAFPFLPLPEGESAPSTALRVNSGGRGWELNLIILFTHPSPCHSLSLMAFPLPQGARVKTARPQPLTHAKLFLAGDLGATLSRKGRWQSQARHMPTSPLIY
jgi:hypothetical protein